jgi:quinohemoprotein amine dehydrogenase
VIAHHASKWGWIDLPGKYFLLSLCLSSVWLASVSVSSASAQTSAPPGEPGIPVKNQLVVEKCGGCHTADSAGNMTRISWIRTTPEGWEEVIKRMVRLNGVRLNPSEAKEILRYLANDHGLAPEEAKPVEWFAEQRIVDENVPEAAKETCNACHAFGKAASWRRSKEEWELLYNMHIGYFPSSEMTTFRRPPPEPGAPPPPPGTDARQPYQKALAYVEQAFPLHTPEWSAFATTVHSPHVAGRWLIAAYKPGEGAYYGDMTVQKTNDPAVYATETKLVSAKSGAVMKRTGRTTVYQGYAWRGRSQDASAAAEPEAAATVREIMLLGRDQATAEGRWMWGDYGEFGFEVRMYRAQAGLSLLGVDTQMLQTGGVRTVRIFGDGFKKSIKPDDIDFGQGVTVQKVSGITPAQLQVEIEVAKNAPPGRRDIVVEGTTLPSSIALYDHIDFIKVTPDTGLSRLGGVKQPKGFVQFEAIAYLNGPDGKSNTADDIAIGPMNAKWSMQEFYAIYGDDDTHYVGTLNAETGLFTPAREGPNPERRFSRNNYGDVWVEAEVDKGLPPPKVVGEKQKPLTARSYLIVTVPQYLRFDQPEVAP